MQMQIIAARYIYNADKYLNSAFACICNRGKIVSYDTFSEITPTNNDGITLDFSNNNFTNFDGSFLANSSVTRLYN